MDEALRQTRWLFFLRLVGLAAALILLPGALVVTRHVMALVGAFVAAEAILWGLPLIGAASRPAWRTERFLGALAIAEALLLGVAVWRFGGPASPFALLYAPLLGLASGSLSVAGYVLVACYAAIAYAAAVMPALRHVGVPAWGPLVPLGAILAVVWLGVLGYGFRRERHQRDRTRARLNRRQALIVGLAGDPRALEDTFWQPFLAETAAACGFASAALVRFWGGRPQIVASSQLGAWEGLVTRHLAFFRQDVAAAGHPELMLEERDGHVGRAIACWPIPPRMDGAPSPGVLCMLMSRPLAIEEVGRRLARHVPWAALGIALEQPRLVLHRAPVDWRVLMNVTLHRLHDRLARYLVLVHVDPGVIEADGLLLADAIAHVIEDTLERTPSGAQVRLAVRQETDGWHFTVETQSPAAGQPTTRHAGLVLARQVVEAHGGAWIAGGDDHRAVGFVLPAAGVDKQGS